MSIIQYSVILVIIFFIVGNQCLVHQIGTKLTRYQYRNKESFLCCSNREMEHKDVEINSRNLIGAGAGFSMLFSHPSLASAIEPGAQEALQLLSGYETRTPYFVTWGMLAVLVYAIAFEIWKKWLAAW
mmetsp:Transcript_34809/g.33119  ORF Transcript_34809/g.33119 Transcript_34809/m.33119 type:complete len:128 (+) Transcript_34809:358-741(+)